jgi:hypothetical protein
MSITVFAPLFFAALSGVAGVDGVVAAGVLVVVTGADVTGEVGSDV